MAVILRMELLLLRHSRVGALTAVVMVAGTVLLLGGITVGVAGGNAQLVAEAGPAASLDWSGLLAGATQVAGVAGLLGGGTILAWMFGRELAEDTTSALLALPCSRGRIRRQAPRSRAVDPHGCHCTGGRSSGTGNHHRLRPADCRRMGGPGTRPMVRSPVLPVEPPHRRRGGRRRRPQV
ncbi:hypothetical protein MANAM107_07330 [Actinomyces capricornis]|uniref:ABC transporter permease n=1 Tax=Actinomyces capricornis TaxID=2755559 RepID=A0ABN6K2T3_9ACTO|nr:hypothetical protein MANAM107_07330 [Actinomyces capricornis]